uniref:Uncharacterized protein n=1 Tax=Xenopus tropicalis TaxID=8364 RepID=A0A6I8R2B4_XENTR
QEIRLGQGSHDGGQMARVDHRVTNCGYPWSRPSNTLHYFYGRYKSSTDRSPKTFL